MQLGLALKSFFAILTKGTLPDELLKALNLKRAELAAVKEVAPPAEDLNKRDLSAQARAAQMLALLQRDARLIDFLREDIRPYADAQIGAAVRSLHENCQQVLDRYIQLEPIISSAEGETVTITSGFDSAAIKLMGNVKGNPPFRGTLRHRGWRAAKVDLPALTETQTHLPYVVAPAEVEIP